LIRHQAFGLCIESNLPLNGLPPSPSYAKGDVRVHLQSDKQFPLLEVLYRSVYLDEAGEPILTVCRTANEGFHFAYRDGTWFHLSNTGSDVFAAWPDELTLEDAVTYLYGPIFGFILRLRGVVSLHGSGVVIEGRGVALLGPPGAGKSTTAAAFARAGFRVLTDDVFALIDGGDQFSVQPAYPGIRLWPESVQNLWGSPDALPQMTPTWEKRYLNLEQHGYGFDSQPVPVAAIYVIAERTADSAAPYFGAGPSFLDLLTNTYAGYVLSPEMRAHEFDVLTRLMSSVPVRTVIPHADPARLPDLCHLIAQDVSTAALS
jgi:hypothetical protein